MFSTILEHRLILVITLVLLSLTECSPVAESNPAYEDPEWTPCSAPTSTPTISSGSIAFTLQGNVGKFHAIDPKTQQYWPGADMSFVFYALQELRKDDPATQRCSEPRVPLTSKVSTTTPLLTFDVSTSAECRIRRVFDEIAPGIAKEAIVLDMRSISSDQRFENLTIQFNMSKADSEHIISYPASTKTGGFPYFIQWSPLKLKFSFTILNWPWQDPSGSYLTLYQNLTRTFNPDAVMYNLRSVPSESVPETVLMTQRIDQGFLFDGDPYIRNLSLLNQIEKYELPPGEFQFPLSSTAFCQVTAPTARPVRIDYDPTLSIIFLSPTPTSNKSKYVIPVAVTVSLVVVLAVAIFIFIYMKNASVRNVFRPFRQRKDPEFVGNINSVAMSNTQESEWQSATKPK